MKRNWLQATFAIIALSVVFAACRKDCATTVTPSQNQRSVANEEASTYMAKSNGRPFKGNMTFTINNSLGLPCNCGSLATVGDFDGVGNITHLGKMKAKNKTCAAPIIVNNNYIGNTITITCGSFIAANGDEIAVDIHPYNVFFDPVAGVAKGTLTADFTGGTGRFVNATGSFTGTITIPLSNPGFAELTNIDGTIGY